MLRLRRLAWSFSVVGLVAAFLAPRDAAAQQSINLYLGGFVPHGLGDRGVDDVFVQNSNTLAYDFGRFKGVTGGAEYLVALGNLFDAGLGVGYYAQTVTATDRDFVYPDGSEVLADLRLRIVPITATVRFLPLGHHDAIVPYVGGGVGIYNWHYSEVGDFVDVNGIIFPGSFEGSGTSVGPVILGGVRVPIGRWGVGGEIRYQGGTGDLPADQSFAAPRVNLGGFNYLFTLNVRF